MFLSHKKKLDIVTHSVSSLPICHMLSNGFAEEPEKFGDKSKGDSLKDEDSDNDGVDDNSGCI